MNWLTNFEDGAIATEKTKIETFYGSTLVYQF
jgi:hypothetical protein